VEDVTRALGFKDCPPFYRDWQFHIAVLLGGLFWLGVWVFLPVQPMKLGQVFSWRFLILTLWQPCAEEVVFRGCLQGQLRRQSWACRAWQGITGANGVTSLLFMLGHWWYHPPFWAMGVIVPSLIFGYCRDRYASVYPCMALHMLYNAGYFVLTGFPQS
jgi:hypothetical protein